LNPLISVVIPTHNSESTIKLCLDSLNSQSLSREEFEIIIVDDGSKDKTVLISKELGVDSVIITDPCFQGKARNIGAKVSKAEFLAFIDSDCIAYQDWLKSIVLELKKLDAVTGPIENGNSQSNIAWGEFLIEFGGWHKYRPRSSVKFLPGCNQAYTKKAFEKTEGFSETRSSEDVLLGEALRQVGINPMFVPTVRIYHLSRTDKERALKNMKLLGKYSLRVRRENPSISYSGIMISKNLIPVLFIGKMIKTLSHSIKARKLSKFIFSLPFIIQGIASFCKGIWEES